MRSGTWLSNVFAAMGSLLLVSPTWAGLVLPSAAMGPSAPMMQPVESGPPVSEPGEPTEPSQPTWPAAWGERLVGRSDGSPTPMFVLSDTESAQTWGVDGVQNAPDSLSDATAMQELSRIAMPGYTTSSQLQISDDEAGTEPVVTLDITHDVVAFQTLSANTSVSYVWGLHTHCVVTTETGGDVATQAIDYFFAYGATSTATAAMSAATGGAATLAQAQPAPAPSCYSQCMAGEHAAHWASLLACLAAGGVGGAAGASVCVFGCLGTGPGYPACVAGCLAAVGITVGVMEAACIAAYVAAMAGAAIGCAIGCWTSW